MKDLSFEKNITEQYIKPEVKVKELSLHSLLGENGWLENKPKTLAYGLS